MEIRVPGIKLYRSHGKVYAYHRKTGTRLKSPIGSAAFLAEIEKLNAATVASDKPKAGTLGALFTGYRASPEFTELAPRTRADYQKVFDYLKPLDGDLLADFSPNTVLRIRDAAFKAHKRRFANYVVVVLSLTFKWGSVRELLTGNPAASIPRVRRPRNAPKANRAWSDAEREAVLSAATAGLRVAIALGMFAGMREGDAITVTRAAYDGSWLSWMQRKTGHPIDVPVDPRLKAIVDAELEARREQPIEHMQLVIGERGNPYTENGFRTVFFRLVRRLETNGLVRPGLTFHGLRHSVGKNVIDEGGTQNEAGALLGHRSPATTAIYTYEADRRKLASAAVARLKPRSPK